jgi:hypothetical protein
MAAADSAVAAVDSMAAAGVDLAASVDAGYPIFRKGMDFEFD